MLCPALFCPAGSPWWAHPGEAAQRGPGEIPVVLPLPFASVVGSDFCWAVQGGLAKLGAATCTSHGRPTTPKPWSSPFCLGFPSRATLPMSRGAEGTHSGQRAESPFGQLGNPDLHPRTLSWNGKFTRTPFLRGFLCLWGSPRERCCTDI